MRITELQSQWRHQNYSIEQEVHARASGAVEQRCGLVTSLRHRQPWPSSHIFRGGRRPTTREVHLTYHTPTPSLRTRVQKPHLVKKPNRPFMWEGDLVHLGSSAPAMCWFVVGWFQPWYMCQNAFSMNTSSNKIVIPCIRMVQNSVYTIGGRYQSGP
jgi:hypothetical protein